MTSKLKSLSKNPLIAWAAPTGIVLVGLLLHSVVHPLMAEQEFLLLYPAVFLGCLIGHRVSSSVATLVAGLAAWWLYFPSPPSASHYLRLGIFLTSGIVFSFLIGARTKRGEVAHEAFTQITGNENSPSTVQASFIDSSESLSEVLESMSDSFFSIDANWKLNRINRQYEKAGGICRQDRLGKSFREILIEKGLENSKYWEQYHRVMNERVSVQFVEYYPVSKIWTECRAYPTSDGGMAVFFSDITGEKSAAEDLERSREHYRIVFDKNPVALLSFDPESFKILDVNAAAVQLYGHSKEELQKMSVIDLRPPESVENFKRVMKELSDAGSGILSVRAIHQRKDGTPMNVDVTVHDVELDGKRVRLSAILDVTKNVELEKRQEQLFKKLENAKEAAEVADRSKTQFLANMSHEIRTPLGAITGFGELLDEPGIPDEERKIHLSTIRRNAELLTKVVDEILDLSKIESSSFEVENIDIDLAQVINESILSLRLKAMERGIDLQAAYADLPYPYLSSDPTRIKQVILNLVGNAVKFTKRGSVKIEVSQAEDGSSGTVTTRILVKDTGIGIGERDAERLFKPFSQADNSMSRRYGGTGLGLVISQKIARMLDGDVELLSSSPNDGSTFEFRFASRIPTKTQEVQQKKPVQELKALEGLSILVVDDAPDNRELLKRFLSKAGARVDMAAHGAEGVSRALRASYSAILMDIQMPILDGYQATRKLRESHYVGPIIALTAHALKSEKDRALSEGFDAYLTKPVNRAELIKTLSELQA